MKKRIFCILLAALLTSAAFTSCGEENVSADTDNTIENISEEGTDTEDPAEETDILEALGTKDLSGQTYTVLNANDNPAVHVNTAEEEKTGDAINDAIAARELFMEENYKLSMEFITDPVLSPFP